MTAHAIKSFLLDGKYLTLEIRVWLNNNFVLLVDNMPDLATTVFREQVLNYWFDRLSFHR